MNHRGRQAINFTGRRFGRLIVRWPVGIKSNHHHWLAQCDCGKLTIVMGLHLPNGHTTSCGCRRIDVTMERSTTHGQAAKKPHQTTEYNSYCQAISRCSNPNKPNYQDYGGRGIEFRFKSFEEFFSELGARPTGMVLDRIDNDGHYEKGNVRWTTGLESRRNRRWTRRRTFQP
jgi:hypothetical protein